MKRRSRRTTGKGAFVSHRCHSHMLELIANKLGSENKKILFSSQFRVFFPFPTIQFQGQMFNFLLRHLVRASSERNRLEFCVNGKNVVFCPRDFALITGLRFDGWFEPPFESETHRVLFRSRQSISLDNIAETFKAECRETGGKSSNALRLACLIVVYSVLVTQGGTVNNVDLKYIHLVDDVNVFLRFPWGVVGYESLVSRTHHARDLMEKYLTLEKIMAFDANSFVLALQVWVYEAMPPVGRNFAIKEKGSELIFPRIRRWTTTVCAKYVDLAKHFSKLQAVIPLKPTDLEEAQLKEMGLIDIQEKRESDVEDDTREVNSNLCNAKNGEMSMVMKRLADLEQCVHALVPKNGPVISEGLNKIKRAAPTIEKGMRGTQKKGKPMDPSKCFPMGTRSGLRSQTSKALGATKKNIHVCPTSGPGLRKAARSHMASINLNDVVSVTTCSITNDELAISLYDPNESESDDVDAIKFKEWTAASKKDSRHNQLKIPCRMVGIVDGYWFDDLWSRRGWLNTSHIDALLNLLLLSSKTNPQIFGSDWTAMEMICWDALRGGNVNVLHDRVSPYVAGVNPFTKPLHWGFAKNIYGVGHVSGDHWISYMISLDEMSIIVFDSLSKSNDWDCLKADLVQVSKNINTICDAHQVWRIRGKSVDRANEWKIVLFEHPPQQSTTSDCGIMAIKFIECLVTGNPLSIIDPRRCGFFRESFCVKLYNASEIVDVIACEDS